MLPYPGPVLEDGVVRLRRWERRDLPCIGRLSPGGLADPFVYSIIRSDLTP